MKNGFSLIEVVIAMTIIAVIGTITTTVVTRTFRTNSQSADISKLKENGERALNSVAESIRMADKVVCYGITPASPELISCVGYPPSMIRKIVIRTLAGKFVKYSFNEPVLAPSPGCQIIQNGYLSKQENINPADVTTDQSFCDVTLASPAPVAIANNNPLSGVNFRNGEFKRLSGISNKDTVTILFNVNPSLSWGEAIPSNTVGMSTTVQVR